MVITPVKLYTYINIHHHHTHQPTYVSLLDTMSPLRLTWFGLQFPRGLYANWELHIYRRIASHVCLVSCAIFHFTCLPVPVPAVQLLFRTCISKNSAVEAGVGIHAPLLERVKVKPLGHQGFICEIQIDNGTID